MSPRETDRLIELAGEVGQRLTQALREVVPPEAQIHLLNAQRELLTALILIYEHQMGARRQLPSTRARKPAAATSKRTPARARTGRIPID